jgi:hypothetical protein
MLKKRHSSKGMPFFIDIVDYKPFVLSLLYAAVKIAVKKSTNTKMVNQKATAHTPHCFLIIFIILELTHLSQHFCILR